MPTTHATHWRQRHLAIRRKGEYEADLLMEDDNDCTELSLVSKVERNVEQIDHSSSPVSVASTFEVEMKPLLLPGSWVVVGKGGKVVKSSKMYDEPEKAHVDTKKKKRKKKKHCTNKTWEEAEPLGLLEEIDASLECLRMLDHSTAQRQKEMSRSQEVKHWAGYQRAKQLKRDALNELIATLSFSDDEGMANEATPELPSKKPTRNKAANSNKVKARRRARSAAAAARCFVHGESDCSPLSEAPALQLNNEPVIRSAPSADENGFPKLKLPDAWATVGKRGKVMIDFPPLQHTPKQRALPQDKQGTKRHVSIEEPPQKPIRKREKTEKKGNTCSCM